MPETPTYQCDQCARAVPVAAGFFCVPAPGEPFYGQGWRVCAACVPSTADDEEDTP
jgi:hypothetical protein